MKITRTLPLVVATIVAAALLAVVLAACGSSSSSSTTSASPTAAGFNIANVKADAALHAMLPAAIKSAGIIRVATNLPYPPWAMYTAVGSRQPTGIDYDLPAAICARLGVKMRYDNIAFDSLIPALLAGKDDWAEASLYENPAREKALDMVSYASDGYGLLVPVANPGNIHTVNDLAGKTIAVQSGTSQVGQLQNLQAKFKAAGMPAMTVLQFPQDSDALLAATSGKAEVVLDDQSVCAYTVKTFNGGGTFAEVNDPSVKSTFQNAIVGIGILKSDPQLRDAVQKALQSLMNDGTYKSILDKYGEGSLAVPSALINQVK